MEVKQVIVVRNDLKIPPGKLGVQISHASESWLRDRLGSSLTYKNVKGYVEAFFNDVEAEWFFGELHKKIVLKCNSEQELMDIYNKATDNQLTAYVVTDFGLTCFKEPTKTAVAIGPHLDESFVGITDHLRVYYE